MVFHLTKGNLLRWNSRFWSMSIQFNRITKTFSFITNHFEYLIQCFVTQSSDIFRLSVKLLIDKVYTQNKNQKSHNQFKLQAWLTRIDMKFFIYFFVFGVICTQLDASNILAVWPVHSRSHFSVGMALFEELAEKGHTVSLTYALYW